MVSEVDGLYGRWIGGSREAEENAGGGSDGSVRKHGWAAEPVKSLSELEQTYGTVRFTVAARENAVTVLFLSQAMKCAM